MDCNLPGPFVHGDSPGKNTGVGCHALLQGIFQTQGSNPCLPHCKRILYSLSHQGSPWILNWVAYPFSRRSSHPRNRTGISCIAGRFFTNWATREALSYLYIDLFCFDCFIWKPVLHNWVTLAQEFCCFKFSLHLGLFLPTFSQINFFISFFKNPFGKFFEIILNLYINLGRPDVLTTLDFPSNEYGISNYLDLL